MEMLKWSIALTVVFTVSGCVYTPRVVETYTPECPKPRKHVNIEKDKVQQFLDCENEGCIAYPLMAGFVSAGTFIVSATVAGVGNAAYWTEHQLSCN